MDVPEGSSRYRLEHTYNYSIPGYPNQGRRVFEFDDAENLDDVLDRLADFLRVVGFSVKGRLVVEDEA